MDFSILEARKFVSPYTKCTKREVKDYEMDMECASGRIYSYDGIKEQRLSSGDILVRRPHGTVSSVGAQSTYLLTLDFSCKESTENYSRNISGSFQPLFENELISRLDSIIHPTYTKEISSIYSRLSCLLNLNSEIGKELVRELIYILNAEISKKNYENLTPPKSVAEQVISYMQENIGKRIALSDISAHLCLEKSYLSRVFRRETGKTPIETLIEMRLDKACDLIGSTDLSVNEIAFECGYTTVSFFISEYKKRYGATPEAHRNIIKISSDTTVH